MKTVRYWIIRQNRIPITSLSFGTSERSETCLSLSYRISLESCGEANKSLLISGISSNKYLNQTEG